MSVSSGLEPDTTPKNTDKIDFAIFRTDVPHRNPEPPLAHTRPLGRWTEPSGFPSFRSGYSVSYWGPEQHSLLTLMEVNPSVKKIRARPEPFEWYDGRNWREHTPAFGVWTDHGCGMFDIGLPEALRSPMTRLRAKALTYSLGRQGITYKEFPREKLKIQPRLGNSAEINACAPFVFRNGEDNRVFDATPKVGKETVAAIARSAGIPAGEAFAAILNLVWRGLVEIDMGTKFSHSSQVWRPTP